MQQQIDQAQAGLAAAASRRWSCTGKSEYLAAEQRLLAAGWPT